MGKLVVSEFITLDGVIEEPGNWSFPYFSEEIAQYKYDELFNSEALLLGRITYEGFAKAWPKMRDEDSIKMAKARGAKLGKEMSETKDNSFSDRMNSMPKFVVSAKLKKAEWNNSTLIKEDVINEISKLKKQMGKDILVNGSSELVKSLMDHNLIDEYRLLIYPIVLGHGTRLFKNESKAKLKLTETKSFNTGVVLQIYIPESKK